MVTKVRYGMRGGGGNKERPSKHTGEYRREEGT